LSKTMSKLSKEVTESWNLMKRKWMKSRAVVAQIIGCSIPQMWLFQVLEPSTPLRQVLHGGVYLSCRCEMVLE
jgi:lambda repressor-like predicted transcriptional regulator